MTDPQLRPLVQALYDLDLTAALPIFDYLPPSDWRWQGLHRLIGRMVYSAGEPSWNNANRQKEFRWQLLELFWPELSTDDPGKTLQGLQRHLKAAGTLGGYVVPAECSQELLSTAPAQQQASNTVMEIDPTPSDIMRSAVRNRFHILRDAVGNFWHVPAEGEPDSPARISTDAAFAAEEDDLV